MDDDVFEEVFGFGDELGVEADVAGFVVATAPFGFHALEEVGLYFDFEAGLPFGDERRDRLVEK